MKVRAKRGVCIGVDRHLVAGDVRDDLDPALVTFLIGIGAIEPVPDEPKSASQVAPAPAGKKEK